MPDAGVETHELKDRGRLHVVGDDHPSDALLGWVGCSIGSPSFQRLLLPCHALAGEGVWLMPTKPDVTGFGILTAYRMPRGSYLWGDKKLVGRYGVEVGRYAQSANRPSDWATA